MNEEVIKQIKYWFFVAVQDCGRWAEKTFPKSTPETIVSHLKEEILEVAEAVNLGNRVPCKNIDGISEEMADVILLLFHLAHKKGIDLGSAIIDKFEKNQKRIWSTEPTKGGHFKHIEEGQNKEKEQFLNQIIDSKLI